MGLGVGKEHIEKGPDRDGNRQAQHQPKLARQVDFARLEHAHKALTGYLRPLGQGGRLQSGAMRIAASLALGLLLLGLVAVWIMVQRGLL